jgi:antitoxin (DNA-binding transcriptional repressor) of toxin-antitoxin stability system
VKAALAGEEVIIASHGQPRVRLVPCSESPGLRHCGALSGGIKEEELSLIDSAFSAEADHAAQQLMEGRSTTDASAARYPGPDLVVAR